MKLSNDIVQELVYEGRERAPGKWTTDVRWDDLEGFGLRLYPSGRKTWVLKYVNRYRKQRWITIGAFPEYSATKARKEAERLRRIVAEGGDPRAQHIEERSGFDVGALCAEYIEHYAKVRKKSWKMDQGRIHREINPRWKSRHPNEITRRMVAKMHRDVAKSSGEVTANRTLSLVSGIFSWGLKEGLIAGDNPAVGVDRFTEKPKDRWVHHDEMRWVLDALDADLEEHYRNGQREYSKTDGVHEATFVHSFFWLVLYTGARKSELLELEWRDVNLRRRDVTFRDTKNGKDHTLPLSTPAAELLEKLPQVEGNPYVFVGRLEGQRLKSVLKAWGRIKSRANELAAKAEVALDVSDVTIHDLRRTVGAWLATAGYSELLIGRVLNHSVKSVTGIYARIADEAVADALEVLARQYQNVRAPVDEKVVELRRG